MKTKQLHRLQEIVRAKIDSAMRTQQRLPEYDDLNKYYDGYIDALECMRNCIDEEADK